MLTREPNAHISGKMPAHQHVYAAMRDRILFGDFIPGQALTIHGLVADTGAGMTPVREALRRLTSEGAVEMLTNRRLQVPILTARQVQELDFMRTTLEPELARRATGYITDAQIADLDEIDARLNVAISSGDVRSYLRRNYQFHKLLYDTAAAPVIAETVDRLWLRFGPSLRVVCGRFGTLNLPDRHVEILAALRARDAEAVAAAVRKDVRQGSKNVLATTDSIDME